MSLDYKDVDAEKESQLGDHHVVTAFSLNSYDDSISHVDQQKLLRKINFHIMPCTIIIILLSFLDRYTLLSIIPVTFDSHYSASTFLMQCSMAWKKI
jgi:hypothetical protein